MSTASRYGVQASNRTWKAEESVKKSHTNNSELQRFELRGKVENVWITTLDRRRSRGDLIVAYKIFIARKESIQWERFFELQHKQKFFSARVLDLRNELDDSTLSADNFALSQPLRGSRKNRLLSLPR